MNTFSESLENEGIFYLQGPPLGNPEETHALPYINCLDSVETRAVCDFKFQSHLCYTDCQDQIPFPSDYEVVYEGDRFSSDEDKGCEKAQESKPVSTEPGGYSSLSSHKKPLHLVAKRNARERKRVQAVNAAFCRLRRALPYTQGSKRVSKVRTLQEAINYINYLQQLLRGDFCEASFRGLVPKYSLPLQENGTSNIEETRKSTVQGDTKRNYRLSRKLIGKGSRKINVRNNKETDYK